MFIWRLDPVTSPSSHSMSMRSNAFSLLSLLTDLFDLVTPLILLSIAMELMQYLSKTPSGTLGQLEVFVTRLTDSMQQNENKLDFKTLTWPWYDTWPQYEAGKHEIDASWRELSNTAPSVSLQRLVSEIIWKGRGTFWPSPSQRRSAETTVNAGLTYLIWSS